MHVPVIELDGRIRWSIECPCAVKDNLERMAPMKKVAQRDKCRERTFAKAGARARGTLDALIDMAPRDYDKHAKDRLRISF